ncbi:YwqG family protein [Exiguobacterium sp. s63]|uniref:YwqG family protein n=1 Tax=Exiguobacterium sp. s63 TaxID=2751274 RepID=UPI001BE75D24|nr:YwqG family protein [Exiguobacterium sp. s63]
MELKTIEQFIQEHELQNGEDILRAFTKRVNLTLVPRTTREEVRIGYSKFGGHPDLPNADLHPGENMTFLAQFRLSDLAEFESVDALPKEGLLSFFYDLEEQPWGDADERHLWRVVYTEDTQLERVRVGEALNERAVSFKESYAENGYDLYELMEEEVYEAFEELFDREELHAIGGHPSEVQGDVFEEVQETYGERFDDPFLLFQMDTSEELDIMFGDAGMLYFLIPNDALRAKRFEETEIIMQCY